MSDRAKLGGGAALGAGGILAVILKSGSAEVHGVEAAARAARAAHAAEEAARIGARGGAAAGAGITAGRGAGIAMHAGEAAIPAERAMLVGAADLNLRPFGPGLAHAAEEGAAAAAQGAGGAGKNAGKTAPAAVVAKNAGRVDLAARSTRSSRVRGMLADAKPGDAVDLLDHLMTAWDLTQKLGPHPEDGSDLDDDVDQKFKAVGFDFRGDIVPSVKGAPLPGLDGATRMLLTDGRALVLAARVDDAPAGTKVLDGDSRKSLLVKFMLGDVSRYAVYVEQPLPPGIVDGAHTGLPLLTSLISSPALDWEELPTKDMTVVPRVIVNGSKRLVAVVAGPTHPTAPLQHLVVVTVRASTNEKATSDRDR